MTASAIAVVLLAMVGGAEPQPTGFGFLYQPSFEMDHKLRGPVASYVPEAGDIIVEADDRLGWTIGHYLAKSGFPHHSLIVFERPGGGLAILEAGSGTDDQAHVVAEDLTFHLTHKEALTGRREKRIWVRCRREPLTPEQSAALTAFALESQGKRFARVRMFLLMTPWRAKGPIRAAWLGKPDLDRRNFFCAELVASALVAAGLLDAELARPAAMFPHDLFHGTSLNCFVNRGLKPLNRDWEPPARWTGHLSAK